MAHFPPATIGLLFADCCPVQHACLLGSFPPCSHPSLWHPVAPGGRFEGGSLLASASPWAQASPVSSAICHQRAAWSDAVDREITITSLAQGTLQSGSIQQDKITIGGEVLNQAAEGFALVAAQQEKCFLSSRLFFLLFWSKSPFAIKLLSWHLYADRSRVTAQPMEPKIRKSFISCTQEIRELVSTFLSVNSSTILDHLYDHPMEKFCPWFKDKCSHFISALHKHFPLFLDPTYLKSVVVNSKKWHEHTEACLITTSPRSCLIIVSALQRDQHLLYESLKRVILSQKNIWKPTAIT